MKQQTCISFLRSPCSWDHKLVLWTLWCCRAIDNSHFSQPLLVSWPQPSQSRSGLPILPACPILLEAPANTKSQKIFKSRLQIWLHHWHLYCNTFPGGRTDCCFGAKWWKHVHILGINSCSAHDLYSLIADVHDSKHIRLQIGTMCGYLKPAPKHHLQTCLQVYRKFLFSAGVCNRTVLIITYELSRKEDCLDLDGVLIMVSPTLPLLKRNPILATLW